MRLVSPQIGSHERNLNCSGVRKGHRSIDFEAYFGFEACEGLEAQGQSTRSMACGSRVDSRKPYTTPQTLSPDPPRQPSSASEFGCSATGSVTGRQGFWNPSSSGSCGPNDEPCKCSSSNNKQHPGRLHAQYPCLLIPSFPPLPNRSFPIPLQIHEQTAYRDST